MSAPAVAGGPTAVQPPNSVPPLRCTPLPPVAVTPQRQAVPWRKPRSDLRTLLAGTPQRCETRKLRSVARRLSHRRLVPLLARLPKSLRGNACLRAKRVTTHACRRRNPTGADALALLGDAITRDHLFASNERSEGQGCGVR